MRNTLTAYISLFIVEKYLLLRDFAYLLRMCGCFGLKLQLSLFLLMPSCVFNRLNSSTHSRWCVLAHDSPHFLLH